MPLFEEGEGANDDKVPTWEEVNEMNSKRRKLLSLARETSPTATVLSIRSLPRTVIPRLMVNPLTWLILFGFGDSQITEAVQALELPS